MSIVVTTAVLVNLFGAAWIILLSFWLVARSRCRKSAGLSKSQKLRFASVSTLSVVLCLGLMSATTWMALRSEVQPKPAGEVCVYDVKAGVSVPVISGGSITQEFSASTDRINAISVIIGLDPTISDLNKPHPVEFHVRSIEEGVNQKLSADNITNNGSTRFNFREPLPIEDRDATFSMRIINRSQEPIGIYIKELNEADTIHTKSEGAFIDGHLDQEAPYRSPNYALSGCVEGRAS